MEVTCENRSGDFGLRRQAKLEMFCIFDRIVEKNGFMVAFIVLLLKTSTLQPLEAPGGFPMKSHRTIPRCIFFDSPV